MLFFLSTTAMQVEAKGLSPLLPLQLSPEIENQIEKVMALTDGAPLTKPYKASDLQVRAEQLKDSHPLLYQRIQNYLKRYKKTAAITHRSAELAASGGTARALPNQRGALSEATYRVSANGFYQANPYVLLSAGTMVTDGQDMAHNTTYLALGYEYAQVEIGYREHWFSPFQDSAMLVSSNAEASPSITISNSNPISDWNIRYEVFYSQLEEVQGIRLGDELFPGRPRHAGLHLSLTPLDFWTLGFNRTLQFGGGKREVDFSDVMEAIFNPAGKDNVGDVDTDDPNYEFGNQQASITSKFNFHLGTPVSLYMEFGGEDTLDESNYKLGNQTYSLGLFLPLLTDDLSLRYEFSHWSTAWYVHHLYQQGYTNGGQVLGHWGGDARQFNDAVPASAHSLNLNWALTGSQIIDGTLRVLQNDPGRQSYETGYEVNLRYSHATSLGFWGAELYWGKDPLGQDFSRLSAFYRW
ncbi:capsule assembly Wzi family protein [Aliiglaciecola sp. CAU 1673]|uniref:capsule assembly Wzi family protein n=1 Tax=Aliiglaciecola sp. CAU 1673 TaxID=3032595 RepID=UPI0023DA8DF2|nr:capsule assembly Wzi family protein [Aliiglaciecola sp. CAU 1673]MDF2179277.1 capsule assembly Wzi family protein [Aliiglaciecola sp. CAU 1673]